MASHRSVVKSKASFNVYILLCVLAISLTSSCLLVGCRSDADVSDPIRFASYNVAMYRDSAGLLAKDLSTTHDAQARNIAAVVQHVRPDVLALMEFDYDSTGATLQLFQENYLAIGQEGLSPITYGYSISFPSNTGVLSGHDFNNDSTIALPDDGFGYGRYAGQYAFSLLSKYPILTDDIRSYQHLLWAQLPEPNRPLRSDGTDFYAAEAWQAYRISSKNHVVVPLKVDDELVNVILAHPTPPVFDGPEDRNGRRNYDEIRVLADIISNADYLVDDRDRSGGLSSDAHFIVMGDLNADIASGDSKSGAIDQLLHHPMIHREAAVGALVPESRGAAEQERSRRPQPAQATSFFGLRIDYVLPSKNMQVLNSGVFWPAADEVGHQWIAEQKASDHLLVFVDVEL